MADDGGEAMVPETVLLPEDYFNRIEEIAARTGAPREVVIRRLIGSGLAQLDEADEDEAP